MSITSYVAKGVAGAERRSAAAVPKVGGRRERQTMDIETRAECRTGACQQLYESSVQVHRAVHGGIPDTLLLLQRRTE